ncbi:penicillin-binding protein [Desemzia sp. RIT804]|uniref:penicillin-binding protein n=1 Tax=Desemzia sp. RIT 804 TaxID=2810209 RepID=UPI001950F58E|nr:penicillin-binding protein [Desemzia sp. RIT 804]MBM6613501.1 penicillin-binding protein [Desemzia sp. RIT 804]
MKKRNPLKNRKLIAILLFFASIVIYAVLAGRFSYIMVKGEVNGENLETNVNNLYTRSSVLEANRGTIYDVGGNPVAMDATSYSLYAVLTDAWSNNKKDPQYVVDKKKTAEALAQYISMSEEEILQKLNQDLSQVEFGIAGKNLSYDIKSDIESADLPGIFFTETPTRLYPNGVFSSHLIGVAQLPTTEDGEAEPGKEMVGLMGIEQTYNEQLTGTDGKLKYQKDSFGYALPNEEAEVIEPVDGIDIYLSLDKRMQVLLESVMTEVNEKYNPVAMTATLMNPKTGKIIATSQRPSFNGTTKEGIDELWMNLLSEYTYEPGSTLKVLTLAAAINEGVFNPNAYFESGLIEVSGIPIRDVNRNGWGTISYLEGLARSSNVAFVKLVQQMGSETWKEYMDAFGIGKSTQSGLYNENAGTNRYNREIDQANTAFGQGLTVTVLQMMQAFSAIANDGQMMKPQFIDKYVDPNTGEETIIEPEVVDTPITKETADQALQYLKEVVYNENGTGEKYAIDGYEIAAKTGTAQIYNAETGKYYSGGKNFLYSVVGMAPADDPELVMYITMERPTVNDPTVTTTDIMASIFNPVMKRGLEYLHLDDAAKNGLENQIVMPKVTSEPKNDVLTKLEEMQLNVTVVGNGDTIVQQLPLADETIIEDQRIILLTNGAMTMPDMTGWSKNDVLKVSEITGIEFSFKGEGYVTQQSLEPNALLTEESQIEIVLESP